MQYIVFHSHYTKCRSVMVSFSLVLIYPVKQRLGNCFQANVINEGILMSAVSSNFIHDIHFYYCQNRTHPTSKFPQVMKHIESDGLLQLYYKWGRNFTVPGTFYDQQGLVNITINSTRLVNRMVSLTWEQYSIINISNTGMDCDVWSLNNVEVTLQYENCTKTVLSEDFEDMWWVYSSFLLSVFKT